MKKVIKVKTDDPAKKQFKLVVTGPVEKVVDISPETVHLSGVPGDTLEAVVNITPSEKYPFSILGMKTRGNAGIKPELVAPAENKKTWQIRIQCSSEKIQNLYDVLTLKTDSRYKPKLIIRVSAMFLKKKASKS